MHRSSRALRSTPPALLGLALTALLLCPAALPAGTNTWTVDGPDGGNVRDLSLDPQNPMVLYAATEGSGVWRTGNGGQFWSTGSEGLDDLQILSVTAHPTFRGRVYATTPSGVAISEDFAGQWLGISGGLGDAVPSGAFGIDPQIGTVVYLGTLQHGVYKSTTSGFAWEPTGPGLPGNVVESLVIDPANPDRIYVAMGTGLVWRSTDAGATWAQSSNGIGPNNVLQLSVDPHLPTRLYAATVAGIYRTLDGGESWTPSNTGLQNLPMGSVAADPRLEGVVYAGSLGRDGVYRSTDSGDSWTLTDLGRDLVTISRFAFDPSDLDRLYLADSRGSGVYASLDGGDSWVLRNDRLRATTVSGLAVDPSTGAVFAATALDGIAASTPEGGWEPLLGSPRNGYCCDHVVLDPANPTTLYAGGIDGVTKSLDGGVTWFRSSEGLVTLPIVFDLEIDPHDPASLAIGSFEGFYRSSDGGATWTGLHLGPINAQTKSVAFDPLEQGTVMASTGTQLHRSTDGGATWTTLINYPQGFVAETLVLDPTNPQTLYLTSLGGGVLKSTDGGASLFEAASSQQLPGAGPLLIDPLDPSILYVGTFRGIWWSEDAGASWEPFEGGIGDDVWVRSFAIDRGPVTTYYAGTAFDGVYSFTSACVADETTLCIDDTPGDARFAINVALQSNQPGAGFRDAPTTSLAPLGILDGGIFSFFVPSNPEVLVKVIDGCGFNDRFWVFAAATTTLGFELTVQDTRTRSTAIYTNPDGQPAATVTDIEALAGCDQPPNELAESTVGLGGLGDRSPRIRARQATLPTMTVPTVKLPASSERSQEKGGSCVPGLTTLCIDDEPGDGRFAVRLQFDTALGGGLAGDAMATSLVPLGITDGGIFSFFVPSNPEVLIKVIDGCGFNDAFWVFYAATTNLGFELTVEDTMTGEIRTYTNPDGEPAETITDVEAFEVCGGQN